MERFSFIDAELMDFLRDENKEVIVKMFPHYEAAEDAIKCYNFWLLPYTQIEDAIASLKGKNLSCWCRLNEKCHADFLLELANN